MTVDLFVSSYVAVAVMPWPLPLATRLQALALAGCNPEFAAHDLVHLLTHAPAHTGGKDAGDPPS